MKNLWAYIGLLVSVLLIVPSTTTFAQNTIEIVESYSYTEGTTNFTNSAIGVFFNSTGNFVVNEFSGLGIYNSDFIIDNESNYPINPQRF